MLLSTTSYLTTGREKSEVMATTNPHTLRKRVTCLCPIGLQQWSECCLRSSQGYTLGLAMPNIPTMGHSRAQKPVQGSSPSLLQKPVGTLQRYSSVNVQRFAARHIECRGYDTTVSRLHNCPREAPSRPFPQAVTGCGKPSLVSAYGLERYEVQASGDSTDNNSGFPTALVSTRRPTATTTRCRQLKTGLCERRELSKPFRQRVSFGNIIT